MVLSLGRRDVARASKSSFVTSMLTALAMCPLEYSSIVRTSSLTTDVSDITCSKASVSMLSNFCCCAVHPRRLHNTAEIIINNFFILFISIYYLRYQSCQEPTHKYLVRSLLLRFHTSVFHIVNIVIIYKVHCPLLQEPKRHPSPCFSFS